MLEKKKLELLPIITYFECFFDNFDNNGYNINLWDIKRFQNVISRLTKLKNVSAAHDHN